MMSRQETLGAFGLVGRRGRWRSCGVSRKLGAIRPRIRNPPTRPSPPRPPQARGSRPAAAASPRPRRNDPTAAPTAPDSTGATYTGAAQYTLTGDKDKDGKIVVTLEIAGEGRRSSSRSA